MGKAPGQDQGLPVYRDRTGMRNSNCAKFAQLRTRKRWWLLGSFDSGGVGRGYFFPGNQHAAHDPSARFLRRINSSYVTRRTLAHNGAATVARKENIPTHRDRRRAPASNRSS